jgi:arylformamidase
MTASETATTAALGIPTGRIVDLSQPLLPGQERYTLEIAHRRERTSPTTKMQDIIYMWSHTGTHIEAPLHFVAGGADAMQIPLDACIGPAIVLDFSHKALREPISLDEIRAAGEIAVGDRVLLRVGGDAHYRDEHAHDGAFPTEEACQWLVEDRKIVLLGTDSGAFDVRGDKSSPNHRIFLKEAGIPVVECLANLGALRRQRVWFVGVPLPIAGVDASPIRAFAIEPEE